MGIFSKNSLSNVSFAGVNVWRNKRRSTKGRNDFSLFHMENGFILAIDIDFPLNIHASPSGKVLQLAITIGLRITDGASGLDAQRLPLPWIGR